MGAVFFLWLYLSCLLCYLFSHMYCRMRLHVMCKVTEGKVGKPMRRTIRVGNLFKLALFVQFALDWAGLQLCGRTYFGCICIVKLSQVFPAP
ncbi:hypothetical protein V8F20_012144 [Naviculisporaceae sp. PSN 640]